MSDTASQANLAGPKFSDPSWAWAPYRPDAERPWDLARAGHLYRRAAFGADWDQLQEALALGPHAAIEKLIRPSDTAAAFNSRYDEFDNSAARSGSTDGLRGWWVRRMCETPFPFLEKMTLFWHDHFAISNSPVSNPSLMCRSLHCLRKNALGSFAVLLEEVADQPAVFAALGAGERRNGRPSDHLPRVLLEQYTVGAGHFTEQDVQAVARGFSGWYVSQNELRYSARQHVSGRGMLLSEEGDFEKRDVVRILSRQEATAQLIVRKLYGWFVSETAAPPDSLINPLAESFVRKPDIVSLAETMLRSNLFFSSVAYRQKIKSPADFALGIIRPFKGAVGTLRLGADLADLGQDLFYPPTVEGWVGGQCWINSFTIAGRIKLARALLAGSGVYGGKLDPLAAAAKASCQTAEAAGTYLIDLLVQGDVPTPVKHALINAASDAQPQNRGKRIRELAMQIASLPEFHLA